MEDKDVLTNYRVSVLKALSDPVRLEIIELLKEGQKCVCEIIPISGRAQSTVSKHLDVLYHANILDRRVEGKKTFYRIRDPQILQVLEALDKFILTWLRSVAESVEAAKSA